jgi:acetylxylan esterase
MPFILQKAFATLLAATTVLAASVQPVPNFGPNPSNIQMNIYVPDKVAKNPPVLLLVWQRFHAKEVA